MKVIGCLLLCTALLVAPAAGQERHAHPTQPHAHHGHGHAPGTVPLLDGLGPWGHTVTTTSSVAQLYFNQGLNLTYGFNHDDAVRSFEEATRLDDQCAMCWWGIAYALGPNINMPMDSAAEARATQAVAEAVRLARAATPRERAYIHALAARYGAPAGAQRATRDSAYAAAMRSVAATYPDDVDAQVLYADALLNLRPWDQWTRAGEPQPGTLDVVAVLERAMSLAPEHAGACHFYVHAIEASPTPERALPCAEKLPRLMPGAGHIVHMPAHVYLRVGRYDDAARANIAAVEADRHYLAGRETEKGIYPLFYAPHNLHFLWAAYMLSGQRTRALEAATALRDRVSLEDAAEVAALEGFLPSLILTHLRFGDLDAVLREPAPPAELQYTRGMWHYARGMALSALGDGVAATAERDSVAAIAARAPEDVIIILNPAPALLGVAVEVLSGGIAMRDGRVDAAIAHYRQAVRLEDALTYDEPPPWYHTTRNMLGEALLAARRAQEAEAVFREDLQFMRENGWSLSGLLRALQASGRTAEAALVGARLAAAWKHADAPHTPPRASPSADPQRQAMRLPTGVELDVRVHGGADGVPVLFLHGYTDSWFSFSPVLPLLPPSIRAIVPSQRGHGGSSKPDCCYGMADYVADAVAVLDALKIDRAIVVGHSFGSFVAQHLAVAHPSRVGGLVLVGSGPTAAIAPLLELREVLAAVEGQIDPGFIREFQEGTVLVPVDASFMQGVIAESGRVPGRVWREVLQGLVESADAELQQVDAPALIIWGDGDGLFDRTAQEALGRGLRRARLAAFPETGHAPHWERPERFVAELVRFVEQLQAPWAGAESGGSVQPAAPPGRRGVVPGPRPESP